MLMLPVDMSRIERALLAIALIFIIVVAIKMTSFIVTLFAMSLILTFLALPAMMWLKGKGMSDFHAVLMITVISGLVILSGIVLTALSFQNLISNLPQYQSDLNIRLRDLTDLLTPLGIPTGASGIPTVNLGDFLSIGFVGAMGLIDAIMFLFFVGVTTFFMLLEAPHVATRIEKKFGKNSEMVQQLNRMTGYFIDFIVVRTETNFIHGLIFGGFLGIIGVQGALLWGVLTFLLGYIPFFGLIIAAVPAIFFAWLQFGMPGAVAVIAVVCILNLIVENPLYSYLAARRFEMPALIVIASVIFWGWLLGLVGMLFAIPITLLVMLVFQLCDELRWINTVIGANHLFEDTKGGKTGQTPVVQKE